MDKPSCDMTKEETHALLDVIFEINPEAFKRWINKKIGEMGYHPIFPHK